MEASASRIELHPGLVDGWNQFTVGTARVRRFFIREPATSVRPKIVQERYPFWLNEWFAQLSTTHNKTSFNASALGHVHAENPRRSYRGAAIRPMAQGRRLLLPIAKSGLV
jgi:hypothetical protein